MVSQARAIKRASAIGRDAETALRLIVRVEDIVEPRLTGHAGAIYESPPQTPAQARMLVRVLLGSAVEPDNERASWWRPIAGGMRTVMLTAVNDNDRADAHQTVELTTPQQP